MKRRKTPRIATWVLNRLSECDEALVGDMVEEYGRGRSRFWYWRQTWIAVCRTTVCDLQSHPGLALRGILLMAVCVLCYDCLLAPFQTVTRDVMWKLSPVVFYPEHYKRLNWAIYVMLNVGAPAMGYLIGAQIVARFHRLHQTTFTLVNAALVLFAGSVQILWLVEHNPRRHLEWFPYYVHYREAILVLFVVSTLVGGLWKPNRHTPAEAYIKPRLSR